MRALVSSDVINQRIFVLRGHKVMLSPHLADFYGVAAKVLVQAVKRNGERFPADFMFRLTWDEVEILENLICVPGKRGKRAKESVTTQLDWICSTEDNAVRMAE